MALHKSAEWDVNVLKTRVGRNRRQPETGATFPARVMGEAPFFFFKTLMSATDQQAQLTRIRNV